MITSFVIVLLNILIQNHVVLGTKYGYFSLCDMLPESKVWRKNHGYELQTWIKSIVPYPLKDKHGTILAGFSSTDSFVNVNEVYSINNIGWLAYGTKRFDGWLYGKTNAYNHFKAGQTYYIFPDYITAFVGTFANNDKMLEGVETKVTHFRCNNGVMELKFKKPKKGSTVFKTIERTKSFASATPHERDPMGKKSVYIGSSVNVPSIANQHALFAKKDIAPHNIVAYYNGIWETFDDDYFTPNMTEIEKEDKHKNLLNFNDTHCIDVTPHMSDLKNYISTLGHKANHHFINDNVVFCLSKHPVFGEIRCLESKAPIKRHEEVLINYGYNVFADDSPKWYQDMYYYLYPHEQGSTMTMIDE